MSTSSLKSEKGIDPTDSSIPTEEPSCNSPYCCASSNSSSSSVSTSSPSSSISPSSSTSTEKSASNSLSSSSVSSSSPSSSISPSSSLSVTSSEEKKKVIVFAEWYDRSTLSFHFFNSKDCKDVPEGLYWKSGPQDNETLLEGCYFYRSICPIKDYFDEYDIVGERKRWRDRGMMPPFDIEFINVKAEEKIEGEDWRRSALMGHLLNMFIQHPCPDTIESPFHGDEWDRVTSRAVEQLSRKTSFDGCGNHHNVYKIFSITHEFV